MSGRSLTELGEAISHLIEAMTNELSRKGERITTVNDETPGGLPDVDAESALKLAEAARELEVLARGPRQTLGSMALVVWLTKYWTDERLVHRNLFRSMTRRVLVL